MQVPVLVFEKQEDVELLMNALHNKKEYANDEISRKSFKR